MRYLPKLKKNVISLCVRSSSFRCVQRLFRMVARESPHRSSTTVRDEYSHKCMLLRCFDRELNNMGIWYRMGTVPRAQDSVHTPTTPNVQTVVSSPQPAPAPAPPLLKYAHPSPPPECADYVWISPARWFFFFFLPGTSP